MDILVGKQSRESAESVLKKKATVRRICGTGVKEWGVMDDESGESTEEEVPVIGTR